MNECYSVNTPTYYYAASHAWQILYIIGGDAFVHWTKKTPLSLCFCLSLSLALSQQQIQILDNTMYAATTKTRSIRQECLLYNISTICPFPQRRVTKDLNYKLSAVTEGQLPVPRTTTFLFGHGRTRNNYTCLEVCH